MDLQQVQELAEAEAKKQNWCSLKPAITAEKIDGEGSLWICYHTEPDAPFPEAVIVRKISGKLEAFTLHGAIGKLWLDKKYSLPIGKPKSNELWLGSAPGRYQLFEGGYIVWDGISGLAYPRSTADVNYSKGRNCKANIAFLDLRGFTTWSEKNPDEPHKIQAVLETLEVICQNKFSEYGDLQVFLKGTGDGLMIVWELGGYNLDGYKRRHFGIVSTQQKRSDIVLHICASIIAEARQSLPSELAIGCGITFGTITQVCIFGQWDYLGKEVNSAAKLQQLAWDEIVVSPEFQQKLSEENGQLASKGLHLAERGIRYRPNDVLSTALYS